LQKLKESKKMNIEEIRYYCLSKKSAEESLPFGPNILVFKIMGKAFLLSGLDAAPLQFNVKCDPEKAISLREQFNCVMPGYHMNKKHWNTIISDGTASDEQLREWISDSYDLVVSGLPKSLQKELSQTL
jgi:predicted DNA-binding protein (MmcQ/YjbR family)